MRKLMALLMLVAATAMLPGAARALDMGTVIGNHEPPDNFNLIHVRGLAKLMANNAGGKLYVYDANHTDFRQENGVIPGARMLLSSGNYDLSDLPADKSAKLVFYCANSH